MTENSLLIIIPILGLIIGSFLNVVICRLPDILSIIKNRSHCPKCKIPLKWYDMIPLISFVILSQKCRYCGKRISFQYPIVELVTAIIFLVLFWFFGNQLYTYFLMLISCFMIVIFVYDLYYKIIPDEVIYPALIIALIYTIFDPMSDFGNKLIGAGVGLAIIAIIFLATKGKGIGFADIKLVALIGLLIGWPVVLISLFLAFVIGAIVGLYLIFQKKKAWKDAIAFGPFLIIGFYVVLFWGQKILSWYLKI